MNKNRFEGFYFKHRKGGSTLAFIPGISGGSPFIQVIGGDSSYYFSYSASDYSRSVGVIKIGNCIFSHDGIYIDIRKDGIIIEGSIVYDGLTPLKYDIMGPFKYFPMECRHGIVSLHHRLNGQIRINGESIDFSDGVGYIEKDSGTSFPKSYIWLQCNDFKEKCSVSVSIADIPFMGVHFRGCICAVYYRGTEYRLATYSGVKIIRYDNEKVILQQGRYRLEADVAISGGHELLAPDRGKMNRTIVETAACEGNFRFYESGKSLFDFVSGGVSFECVQNIY